MKILISAGLAVALIAVVFMITKNDNNVTQIADGNNVTIVDGKQIIDLRAKGGYSPQKSVAKAGMPTIVRFTTNGNFDCSSSVRISSMNLSKNLALSGTTDIDLGSPKEGILHGSCGMGMYPFEIDFQI